MCPLPELAHEAHAVAQLLSDVQARAEPLRALVHLRDELRVHVRGELGQRLDICSSLATGDGNSPSRNASLSMRTIPTSASIFICSMRRFWSKT